LGRSRHGRRKQGVHVNGIEIAAPPAVFADHFDLALLVEYRTDFRFAKEPEDTFGAAARAATTEYCAARLKNAKIVFREQSRQQTRTYAAVDVGESQGRCQKPEPLPIVGGRAFPAG
jgi:hypothetical protein